LGPAQFSIDIDSKCNSAIAKDSELVATDPEALALAAKFSNWNYF